MWSFHEKFWKPVKEALTQTVPSQHKSAGVESPPVDNFVPSTNNKMGDLSHGLKNWFSDSKQKVVASNFAFDLHHRISFLVFAAAAAGVYFNTYVKSALSCENGNGRNSFAEDLCWSQGLFYMDQQYSNTVPLALAYQWTGMLLVGQAILFQVPYFLWKAFEASQLDTLVNSLTFRPECEKDEEKLDYIVARAKDDFFLRYKSRNIYFFMYLLCEIMQLVVIIVHFNLTSSYCDFHYLAYGFQYLRWDSVVALLGQSDKSRWPSAIKFVHAQATPLIVRITAANHQIEDLPNVFPSLAICHYQRNGISGDTLARSALCVINVNTWNERIYVFLWFYLMCLFLVSLIPVIYHLILCLPIPGVRAFILRFRIPFTIGGRRCETIACSAGVGDIFMLMQLRNKLFDSTYKEFLLMVARGAEQKFGGRSYAKMV